MATEQMTNNPERFDPRQEAGRLIDSEHQARYRWAARIVAGKEVLDVACGVGYGLEIYAAAGAKAVTGADVDVEAVATARERYGKNAEVVEGDLRELPFADERFDVVTCFETIEHIEGAERAFAELRRVLRPAGVLVVSSPNPEVYRGGNEHHVHEFRPEELAEAVGQHFAKVTSYEQRAWLGSSIAAAGAAGTDSTSAELVHVAAGEDEGPTYGIVVASDSEPPPIAELLAAGDDFDVRWWAEQVANVRAEAAKAFDQTNEANSRLHATSHALMEANQQLAQLTVLRHRLATVEKLHADLSEQYHAVLASTSWKITKPLRRGG